MGANISICVIYLFVSMSIYDINAPNFSIKANHPVVLEKRYMLIVSDQHNRETLKWKENTPKHYYSTITLIQNNMIIVIFVFKYMGRKVDI